MDENEEFEFRHRLEQEQEAAKKQEPVIASAPAKRSVIPQQELTTGERLVSALPSWLTDALMTGNKQLRGIAQGAADPSVGLAQLAANAVGQGAGLNKFIKSKEAEYQAQRGNTPDIDWSRLAGNIISPMNILPASKLPVAGTLTGRVGQGAALGAMAGAEAPVVNPDEYWKEKAVQTGLGALGGGVAPVVAAGAARVIRPNLSPDINLLSKEGVKTTAGQTLGGIGKAIEDRLTSLPIVGDAIQSARREGVEDFNRAVYNRILSPLGEEFPKDIKPGFDAMKYLHNKVNEAYDDVFKNVRLEARPANALPSQQAGRVDPGSYLDDLAALRAKIDHIPAPYQKEYDKIMENFYNQATPQGNMSGESLNQAIKHLKNSSEKLNNTQDVWAAKLRDGLKEAQSTVLNALERQNPEMADKLSSARSAWHAYALARDAASSKGASTTGIFTPSQLQSTVLGTERKLSGQAAGRGKAAEGRAFMQDLANAGQRVLPSQYPDSGTAGRMLANTAVLGGGAMLSPQALVGMGAATLPYLPGGRWVTNKLLTARPEIAGRVAGGLRQASPALAPAFVPRSKLGE